MDWQIRHRINESIFPKPRPLEKNVKVEWDLPNYATKADLKNETGAKKG